MKKVLPASLLVAALILAASEAAFWFAAQSGPPPSDEHSCAVLVLGYPANADGTTSAVARFRVESGVQIYREHRCGKLVLSGGAIQNEHIEAESMATVAERLGVSTQDIVVERRARSTWENVGCSAPLVASADRVLVVSDSLHARRAARYACRQDAELCEKFLAMGLAPPIDLALWGIAVAANELRVFVRDLLLYRSGAVEDAPRCSGGEAPR
jgi:uncharacterized SAM-binding protein YcdF (DUF218 family)